MKARLPADLEQLVQDKVTSGRYRSADEVMRIARRSLEEQEEALGGRTEAFKAQILHRLATGPTTPMDFSEVKRRIRAEVDARTSRTQASREP